MDEQGTTFSLIEMFRITYNAIYTIDYYIPRYHNTEATHEQFVEFRNFYKLRNNFIFSTEHLNLLQLIVANVNGYSADPFEVNIIPGVGQKWNPPLPPIITTYKVKIFRLKINLIKMVQSSELAHISLNKVILRAKNHLDSTIMRSKMIIDILYHNKRKMNFEPFLEPWCFTIRYKALGEEKLLEIGNWQPPSKDNELEE
jgi:vacuolar protein sorting-associated protein 13A/C